jgi:hypothetical protein
MALTGGAAEHLARLTPPGMTARIHLTLSDEHPYAQAFVVIEALPRPLSGQLAGFVRVSATDLADAATCLEGNPVYEAGGTIEIRLLPETV